MYCVKCGSKIEENSRFCEKCGEKIENGTQQVSTNSAGVKGNTVYSQENQNLKQFSDKSKFLWMSIIPFDLLYFMLFHHTSYPSAVDRYENINGVDFLNTESFIIAVILNIILAIICWALLTQGNDKNVHQHKLATIICTIIGLFVLSCMAGAGA